MNCEDCEYADVSELRSKNAGGRRVTLDEAIKHCEEKVEKQRSKANVEESEGEE